MNTERNMDKKDNDKWLNNLRERMDDYVEPLPEGLWEELEGELARPKIIPFWRRWPSVAAAVALVLVVSSLALSEWFAPLVDSPEIQTANQLAEDEALGNGRTMAAEDVPVADYKVAEADAEKGFVVSKEKVALKVSEKVSEEAAIASNSSDPLGMTPVMAYASGNPVEEDSDKQAPAESTIQVASEEENVQPATRFRSAERTRVLADHSYHASYKRKHTDRGVEFGVLTGGIPYSASKQFAGMSRFASRSLSRQKNQLVMGTMSDNMTAFNRVLFNNRDKMTSTEVKHRMPINVVASVKWHFADDWALESGVSYTYLQSELHSGSHLYWEDTQKLHYVGIPLKVHRAIWGNSRMSLYASAGGMVEKCVSGTMESVYVTSQTDRERETTSIDEHPFQWSVSAAVGAQVNLLSSLSLFVEPGVAYYFDDNSHLETIRKEHPFNFNLQFGLRFDLTR